LAGPGEGALEQVAGPGRLVAGTHRAFGSRSLEVPAQLLVVVGKSIDSHGLRIAVTEDRDGDRVLVDVEADAEVRIRDG
jgi:hypothetical protein